MPEIGEIGRIVHYLRKHAVGRTVTSVRTEKDDLVFNTKVGTTAALFTKAMEGNKIIGARQLGKYFWLEMEMKPHPLMHFGMTGWIHFDNDKTGYYKPEKEKGKKADEGEEWPPRFWKFVAKLEGEGGDTCEMAFVDGRRLARIRLMDCEKEDMRNTTPLKENGPDPVQDKDVLTVEWLGEKLRSKKTPVKALLLDQGNISGVGNWVA